MGAKEIDLGTPEKQAAYKRRVAGTFGLVFAELAQNPTDENKQTAARIWVQRFGAVEDDQQMCADAALVKLGLAVEEELPTAIEGQPKRKRISYL